MPKSAPTRNYSMSDGDLKQKADALAANINRDLADFAIRNITATTVANLNTIISIFDNTITDTELLGEAITATEVKNDIAENIKKAIRPIRNMAEIVYDSKGKYNIFGFKDMANMVDADLYRLAKKVVRVSTKFFADLVPQGLTVAQLNNLTNLAISYDAAIDDIENKIENREIETLDRVKKGNHLWSEMSKLASVGKSIYEHIDEARYNDYVLST